MRWVRVTVLVSVTVTLGAAVFLASCATQQAPAKAEMTLEQKIARGRALTFVGGCQDCHTPGSLYGAPDTTRMLSGSDVGWQGPWGVSYARNLTPDPETGIGNWTEDQIVTAFRMGHRPDGSPLLPPMPWPMFGIGMSDEDANAIAAFLKSLPPVTHKVPDVIPPGKPVTGPVIVIPPPAAWDAMNLPSPPPAGGGK
jgi:mono/diheme cytochrome c family protein